MAKLIQIGFLFLLLAIDWAFDTDQGCNCLNGPMSSQLCLRHVGPTDMGSSEYEGNTPVFMLFLPICDLTGASSLAVCAFEKVSPRFNGFVNLGYLFMCLRQ